MLITTNGVIIRFHARNISQTGRATQGVRLMRLEEGNAVSTLAKVLPEDEEDESDVEMPLNDDADLVETPIESELNEEETTGDNE